MANMPVLRTVSELYPPQATPELTKLVRGIVGFFDNRGRPELRRALSPSERQDLVDRKATLERWLEPGRQRDMTAEISRMLMGTSNRSISTEQAMEIAAQYAHVCRDLPFWAVCRACQRFATGQVRPDDVGDPAFSPSFVNTAHVYRLAFQIANREMAERDTIEGILAARPAEGVVNSEAGRAAAAEAAKRWRMEAASKRDLDEAEREVKRQADAKRLREKAKTDVAEQYRRAGLRPPEWGPEDIPVSLPMMLMLGYRIEEIGSERVLVAPSGQRQGGEA